MSAISGRFISKTLFLLALLGAAFAFYSPIDDSLYKYVSYISGLEVDRLMRTVKALCRCQSIQTTCLRSMLTYSAYKMRPLEPKADKSYCLFPLKNRSSICSKTIFQRGSKHTAESLTNKGSVSNKPASLPGTSLDHTKTSPSCQESR